MTKRYFMRKKDARAFREHVAARLSERAAAGLDGAVEVVEGEGFTLVLVGGERSYVVLGASLAEGLIVPFLGRLLSDDLGMKRVAVDRGAIPFVTSGADVMRPGIVRCDSAIAAGDLVLVVDEAHGKPLAVGTALHPGSELVGGAGKGVKVLHYVGDEVWSFAASGG